MDGRPAISSAGDGSLIGVATRHNDHYHLSVWDVEEDGQFTNSNIMRSGSSVSGSPAVAYRKDHGVPEFVVAMRAEPGGDLLVEGWKVLRDSSGLTFGSFGTTSGFASNIGGTGSPSICAAVLNKSAHPLDNGSDLLTAIRNKDQRLAVHRWRG
jgi:hypothetical protein